jgi:hypothetical protein
MLILPVGGGYLFIEDMIMALTTQELFNMAVAQNEQGIRAKLVHFTQDHALDFLLDYAEFRDWLKILYDLNPGERGDYLEAIFDDADVKVRLMI